MHAVGFTFQMVYPHKIMIASPNLKMLIHRLPVVLTLELPLKL